MCIEIYSAVINILCDVIADVLDENTELKVQSKQSGLFSATLYTLTPTTLILTLTPTLAITVTIQP